MQHNHPESSWLHVKTIKIVGHCDTALKTVYAKTYNQNSQLKAFFSYIQIQNDVMDTLKLTTTYLSNDENVWCSAISWWWEEEEWSELYINL